MFGTHPLFAVAISLLVTTCALSTEIPIVFTITQSVRTQSIAYSTGNTSSQHIQQYGTMSAILTFDPKTQKPTAINFTEGTIYQSASSFKNTADIYFYGLGSKRVTFVQSSTGLQLKVKTNGNAHSINSDGWLLESSRLSSFPISGILTAKLTIDGRTQTQSINVATNPPDSVEPSMGTEIRLQVVEREKNGGTSDYEITFTTSLNTSQSSTMQNTDTTVTNTNSGSTLAVAAFSARNKYGQWLLDNGYDLDEAKGTNDRGIPLEVLFALQVSPNAPNGIPWYFTQEQESLILNLQLPLSGLEETIRIESCDDLRTGKWEKLLHAYFRDGNTSLAKGASGERRIHAPGATSRFYRIVSGGETN